MAKFLAGVLVGGVLVAALISWLDRPEETGRFAPATDVASTTNRQSRSPATPKTQANQVDSPTVTRDRNQSDTRITPPDAQETQPNLGISASNSAVPDLPSSVAPQTSAPVTPAEYRPIPIGKDHAEMFDKVAQIGPDTPSTVGELHEQLEQEEEDLSWAYDTEIRMAQFLSLHPSGQMFQIDNIECRSVVCQIQATGFNTNSSSAWGVVMEQMRAEPWANFVSTSTSAGSVGDKLVIVTFLARNVP